MAESETNAACCGATLAVLNAPADFIHPLSAECRQGTAIRAGLGARDEATEGSPQELDHPQNESMSLKTTAPAAHLGFSTLGRAQGVNVAYHFTCIANDRIELWANFNRGQPMTLYQGEVEKYTLSISDPSRPTNWKNWIALEGSFGVAFLYFVPPGGSLRPNKKRAAFNTFDIDYWMSSYPQFIDMLRNEKPVYFLYDDSSNRAEVATNWEPVGEAEPLTA